MKAWTLKQLWEGYLMDLNSCNNDFERGMVRAVCFKEMRKLSEEIRQVRKFTPIEEVILENIGERV